jgi:hypothetical protein
MWARNLGDCFISFQMLVSPALSSDSDCPHFLRTHLSEPRASDVSFSARFSQWFQNDGAPPNNDREARRWLSEDCPGLCICSGREDKVSRPARLPDFNSPEFFLWGYFKTKVCGSKVDSRAELWLESIICVWNKGIQLESSNVCEFLFHAQVSCAFVKMEVISNTF